MNTPRFITFTGADDYTDVAEMIALSREYPVEYGILMSPKQQGSGRYPSVMQIAAIVTACRDAGVRIAAHVCGGYSRAIVEQGELPPGMMSMLRLFNRVQINHAGLLDAGRLRAAYPDLPPMILQYRDATQVPPEYAGGSWLFDASGGRGIGPARWPTPPADGAMRGYAGGIDPHNVHRAITALAPLNANAAYWIDMETGVRSTSGDTGVFLVAACRRVCEAVYGQAVDA